MDKVDEARIAGIERDVRFLLRRAFEISMNSDCDRSDPPLRPLSFREYSEQMTKRNLQAANDCQAAAIKELQATEASQAQQIENLRAEVVRQFTIVGGLQAHGDELRQTRDEQARLLQMQGARIKTLNEANLQLSERADATDLNRDAWAKTATERYIEVQILHEEIARLNQLLNGR